MIPANRIPYLSDIGLLIGRVALGVVFVAHGWQKLNDMGHANVTKFFESVDVPLASLSAYYSTWVELIGGFALIVGVVTPIVGLLLAIDMAGAFLFVHKGNGMFVTENGYELVLALGATAILLALAGAGRFSVDGLLFNRNDSRENHGAAA
ncbi:putative oxidoreductase [Actinomadura pelletieri DSM 43383]|uniref:Putative oxidoreductase n=1 Tax=Actinomadura pelletieri DSM 43383 TaxID=1120940 RepID=A0A495QZQ3_9ACTN|nr:DoxX family protein [Actinomadura pelletieri]RKS79552.1 putative oxidoreductase [Actinomadura pelletieri DSM 43383]